eukprot:CAMPEP_0114371032 /NCGR_PEP_ID=MMETSP0101-20121206/32986_1 /TAXON_ID=38822 ORGANISM="Pteridomonas danica, Strain PT" /NCGR_SAMPLE_ID=MMETSP0101 /ASSEMBLY_ACC=CAM_ASM_000211 /LENGTH=259 /DNA_ID=CAMNT_0001522919 /DNA_START=57 /DNA_END=837 /DNA_ORIENTATION=+
MSITSLSFVQQLIDTTLEQKSAEIVCYGIGSPSYSPKARVQFALAEILRRNCAPSPTAWYFDPIISETDRRLFDCFGWKLISKDEEGKRTVVSCVDSENMSGGSLFFCLIALSVFIVTFYGQIGIQNQIIGNSFCAYDSRVMMKSQRNSLSNCVLRIQPYTNEISFDQMSLMDRINTKNKTDLASSAELSMESIPPSSLETKLAKDENILRKHRVGLDVFGDMSLMHWTKQKLSEAEQLMVFHSDNKPPEEFGVTHGGW